MSHLPVMEINWKHIRWDKCTPSYNPQHTCYQVILSACSPFFRGVLKRNPHNHPLLYLRGIKYESILAILNFMYNGEVNIAQAELSSFLAVAEDLQVDKKNVFCKNRSALQPSAELTMEQKLSK